MKTEIDWQRAEEHLSLSETAYASIGSSGYFALNYIIRPLRDRFNKGERSPELYKEIMEIEV